MSGLPLASGSAYSPHRTNQKRSQGLSGQSTPFHDAGHLVEIVTNARLRTAARFNRWLAVKVTELVGTMWCAYAFAGLALLSLPSAVASGSRVTLISWVSQTFLQLVLLSVIIAGQNVMSDKAARKADTTLDVLSTVLERASAIEEQLLALGSREHWQGDPNQADQSRESQHGDLLGGATQRCSCGGLTGSGQPEAVRS